MHIILDPKFEMRFQIWSLRHVLLKLLNSALVPFCLLAAVSPALGQQTEIQYLSGTDKDNTVPWQFSVSSGRLAGIASNIPVPSCWQMQGFGTYSYTQNTGSGMTSSN